MPSQDQGEASGNVVMASRDLEKCTLTALPSLPRETAYLLPARHAGLSAVYLEDVVPLGVDGGGVDLPTQVDETPWPDAPPRRAVAHQRCR